MGISFELKESRYSDYESLLKDADYALVIGDDAIKAYSGSANILLDVGLEFSKLYGLEPVYAVAASFMYFFESSICLSRSLILALSIAFLDAATA